MSDLQNILCISVTMLGEVIEYVIMIRILFSIFNVSYDNPIMRFLYTVTEPILSPARALLERIFRRPMMLDFSPVVVWLFLDVAVSLICRLIRFIIM